MPRPLRVLLISGEYPPMEGGVADFCRLLGQAMARQDWEVHVLTSAKAVQSGDEGPVHCHPLMRSWRCGRLRAALRRLLSEVRPDVVNIQYQTAAFDMRPAINCLPLACPDVPTVVTFHDLLVPYLFPKAGPLRWWVNLALARWCSAVIVTNAEDEARLKAYPWIRRLTLVPIGSNLACAPPAGYDRTAWRRLWGIGDDTVILCYFGFLNASKGGEELIAALDRLRQAGCDAVLLMIGGSVGASDPTNRTYHELVQASIRERGLESQVIWTGHLPPEEVSAGFGAADICVLPYRDGASFRRGSFLAALTHGMPVITTQPRAPLPALTHGQNVWLVPPRDPEALAKAMALLAEERHLRRTLSHGARQLSRQFDWQQIAARTIEVYDRAITTRR
ncbi:MAG TPA: glycosyltransferase family 4 protein [Anaerolineae bacterium]|nr:glycosyltransferase family 4 protein [Anaerolineae bacterium]